MEFWHYLAVLIVVVAALAFLGMQKPAPPLVVFPNSELASDSPALGPEGAKVTIVEFSDYQCPACLTAENSVKQLMQQYNGKVRFVYRNFPLYSIHPNAGIAAEAALAAGEQGKFWEMHDKLFENQQAISKDGIVTIKKIAKELNLDEAKFNGALESRKFASAVKKDYDDALRFGSEGTPTFFINGTKYFGAYNAEQLKQIIDAELAKVA